MERIAELQPDLIVTNGAVEGLRETMKSADIAVAGYFPQSMDSVMDQITQIAELTNTQETGRAIVADMKARREAVAASVAGLAQPTVFYEVWGDPLMVAGKGSFINEMIAIAGGKDIAGDSQLYSTYDVEQLIEQNPDIYLINDGDPTLTPETLAQRPGYADLKAVTGKQVLTINADLISRPGPRLIDGLEALADLLHLIERSNMKTRWVLIVFAAVFRGSIGGNHRFRSYCRGEAFQSLAGKVVGAEEILPKTQAMILYGIRGPRVLLSLIAGAALATAGLALQGLFRNPLADPYIIGISSGSAFGAAVAIATGIGSSLLGNFTVTASAFLGA